MNLEKIRHIDQYIQNKQTGTPAELSRKIRVSPSMLFRYLNYMKSEMKAPIVYSRSRQTYYYENQGELTLYAWKESVEKSTN